MAVKYKTLGSHKIVLDQNGSDIMIMDYMLTHIGDIKGFKNLTEDWNAFNHLQVDKKLLKILEDKIKDGLPYDDRDVMYFQSDDSELYREYGEIFSLTKAIKNYKMKASKGLIVSGPTHENGGVSAKSPDGVIEVEGGEAIVNKETMSDPKIYTLTGTLAEIVSEANMLGGGVPLVPVEVKPKIYNRKPKRTGHYSFDINKRIKLIRTQLLRNKNNELLKLRLKFLKSKI